MPRGFFVFKPPENVVKIFLGVASCCGAKKCAAGLETEGAGMGNMSVSKNADAVTTRNPSPAVTSDSPLALTHNGYTNGHHAADSGTTPHDATPDLIQRRYFAVASLKPTGDGKLDKAPRHPVTLTLSQTNDIDTLGTYAEACQAVRLGRAKAMGPVLKRDGIIAIDLDAAFDPQTGVITDGAAYVVSLFPGALITRSVSGRGLHIWIKAKPPAGMTGAATTLFLHGQKVEILVEKFVVERWEPFGAPGEILPMQKQLDAFYSELKEANKPTPTAPRVEDSSNGNGSSNGTPGRAYVLKVLENARKEMEATPEGVKHDRRLKLARNLGGYLHTGHITRDDIIASLSVNFGPDSRKAEKAILDGITNGEQEPRDVPEPRNGYKGAVCILGTAAPLETPASEAKGKDAVPLTLGLPLDDIGNGQRFATQHGHAVRYCDAWKSWLIYDGRRWLKDEKGAIEQRAKVTARLIIKEAEVTENEDARAALLKHATATFKRAKRETMVKDAASEPGIPITVDELDTDKRVLNVINGTLDLRTGKLRPHNSSDLITKLAPVDYDPHARCPLFIDFLNKIFAGNTAMIDSIQRALGYALTGDTSEQNFIIAHGGGSNGKSTLLQTVARIMGDYALEIEPTTIMVQKQERMAVDIADLFNVRFVVTSESNDTQRLDEAKMKKMTGGEQLTGERKFEHPFKFWPQFKLFLATNHMPEIRGTDNGIWRRVVPVPFDVCFWKEDEGAGAPELKADPGFAAKLENEYSGILTWLVEGCLKWDRDGLSWPEAVKKKKADYREEQDVLAPFLDDCCVIGQQYGVTAKKLNSAYQGWCEENGARPLSAIAMGKHLKERGFISTRSESSRSWKGIGLLSDPALNDAFERMTHSDTENEKVCTQALSKQLIGKMRQNASGMQNASGIGEPSAVEVLADEGEDI